MARRAHNPEIVGSNPAPATNAPVAQLVEQWIEDPCVLGSTPSGGTMNKINPLSSGFSFAYKYYLPNIHKNFRKTVRRLSFHC